MPSVKKRFRGDQFIIIFPIKSYNESIAEEIVDQTKALGAEIRILMGGMRTEEEMCLLLKTSTSLDFRGEEKLKCNSVIPSSIEKIENRDIGLQNEISNIKKYSDFHEHINAYKNSNAVVRTEKGGFMAQDMSKNPNFDPEKETKFGRGHRRVIEKKNEKNVVVGFTFVPFRDYTPEWASDIYGYDTFKEALSNIYPYTISDVKILEEIYMQRPVIPPTMHMEPTRWQSVVYKITDRPIPVGGKKQREFHCISDFSGEKGKSMLADFIEYMRGEDTIILSSLGSIKDLIHSVKRSILLNSRIKNIIIDIPKQIVDTRRQNYGFHILDDADNEGDIYKFAEMCANGRFTSTKYESCNFRVPAGGMNVIFFTNSMPFIPASTLSRWHLYVIKDMNDFIIEDLTYPSDRAPITTMKETAQWYLSIPEFREYLKLQKIPIYDFDKESKPFKHNID